jgi:hypothetical protein
VRTPWNRRTLCRMRHACERAHSAFFCCWFSPFNLGSPRKSFSTRYIVSASATVIVLSSLFINRETSAEITRSCQISHFCVRFPLHCDRKKSCMGFPYSLFPGQPRKVRKWLSRGEHDLVRSCCMLCRPPARPRKGRGDTGRSPKRLLLNQKNPFILKTWYIQDLTDFNFAVR